MTYWTDDIDSSRVINRETAEEVRPGVLSGVLDAIKQVKSLEQGYSLRFESDQKSIIIISDWIQIERICQPFLRFKLNLESNFGPVWLDMKGPKGTKTFLENEYGLMRWL